jgi:hypothetical protein
MRALAVINTLEKDQKRLIKAFEAAFQAFWVEGRNIVDPLVLTEILEKTLGADLTRKGWLSFIIYISHRVTYSCRSFESPACFALKLQNFTDSLWHLLVNEMIPKEGKDALLTNTDKALEDGAFGLPWFTCTDREGNVEGFWGIDHLGQVTQFLGLETPKSGGWKALL